MQKNLILSSLLTIGLIGALQAQVGIGTMNPNAQLTIDSGVSGIAPLELTDLSSAPNTNLAGGQLAVINDELYFYEPGRAEWLSVTTMPLEFTRNGSVSDNNLYFGGRVTNQNAGAVMPLDGTIVHISAISSGGNTTKRFQLRVRNGGANVSSTDISLVSGAYNDTSADIDFSAGDVIALRARDDGNGDVNNPSFIVWIKWRQ